jgi:hypothetical protein
MAMDWQVTGQHQETRLRPGGQGFEPVWVISYQTFPELIAGNVEVPERLYNEEYVRDTIDRLVKTNKAIHGL